MIRVRARIGAALALLAAPVLCATPASAQVSAPTPASAPGAARLVQGSATYPTRSVRLIVPQRRALTAAQLQVSENGEPVGSFELVSSGAGQRSFGAVIVMDASKSMRGPAIREAVAAARALAEQRVGSQRIGIVTFNATPRLRLALSDDAQTIRNALATPPPLAPKTRIFDGVSLALDHLRQARIDAGSIVVLSDGADTGSSIPLAAVARRARAQRVRIHTVGLRSGAFDQRELHALASAADGRYTAAASVTQLRAIFRELGSELASEYLIRYTSGANPGSNVRVAVRVDGIPGIATIAYTVPGDASFVLVEESFWTSTLGLVAATLLFGALVALALAMVLLRRLKGPDLRERVKSFVFPMSVELTRADGQQARILSGAERSLETHDWWLQFKQDVEIARIEMPAFRIAVSTVLGTILTMYLMALISGIALLGLAGLAVPFGVRTFVRFKRDRQRHMFADQLPDMLQGTASAIRAGHGFVGALAIIVEDAPEPSRSEFQRVVADEQLGVPLDEALAVVQHRMDSRDVQQIALVAQIQREAGGNSAEVLDRVTEAVRQRGELQRMVRALTAQGRLSRWVVTALPVSLLVIISLLNPDYMKPLFETGVGLFLLAIAGISVTMGSLVIKKIVDFEV